MNTLTKGFAKRVISMLLVTIMVFSLGIVGLTSVSAANTELAETGWGYVNCVFYFDNSVSKWSGVQIIVGRDYDYWEGSYKHEKGSQGYKMTNIPNTDIWYVQISDFKFVSSICFTNVGDNWGWSGSGVSDQINYLKTTNYKYSNAYPINEEFQNNRCFKADSASSPTSLSYAYYASTDDMNKINQKVYAKDVSSGKNSSAVGTVKVEGYFMSGTGTTTACSDTTKLNSSYTANINVVRSSKVTLTANPAAGYEFVGWTTSSSATTSTNTDKTFSYYSSDSATIYYALFKKAVSISNPKATINTDSIVLGNSADITVDYTVTGSSSTPTLTLCDGSGNPISTSLYTVNGKVITVTPDVAQNYVFKVKITVDGVDAWTNTVNLECKKEYSISLAVDRADKYTGDLFTFTIKDNAELYTDVTYAVYCDDTLVTPAITDKTFTVSHDRAGEYVYHVVATVDGKTVNTDKITITVKEKVFSVYLTAPKSTMEDRPFEIKATTEFAASDDITFELKGTDGTSITNKTGIFSVTVNTVGEYTFTVTAYDGTGTATRSVKVTITEDKGTYPIRILFKCSDTYGYLPNMSVKINGNEAQTIERQKYTVIESRPNATDTATYSWYYYEIPDVDYGTDIVFSANATRNYFYNASITIKAGQGDFVQDGTFYCYYLALENLNGGTNVLSNISNLSEAERNWTASAVNMIYDDADALLPVGVNFAYADMADANTDGKVNVKDATYIQKSLANIVEASALSTAVSDVNGDGKVTIKDATALQKQIAGL